MRVPTSPRCTPLKWGRKEARTATNHLFASPSTRPHVTTFFEHRDRTQFLDSMSQYFQRIRESVSALISGTNRAAKRSAPDNDTDHHTLANPACKRRDIRSKEGFLANADDGAEEFRLAFEGNTTYHDAADEIRTNDPRRTTLHLGADLFEEELSDDAARLLGRYITSNDHIMELRIPNGFYAVDSLFEGLRGSRSLVKLAMNSALSEELVQAVLPLLSWARTPKLKELRINLGSASLRPIIRTLHGRSIECLSLRDCNIDDVSEIGSCNLPNLKRLDIEESGIISVPSLHGFPELKSLLLSYNKIDSEGFARLNAYLASDSCQLYSLFLIRTGGRRRHFITHSSTQVQ